MEYFTVYFNDIEGRLDPHYLRTIFSVKNIKTKYPLVALGDLLKEKPQYGANERAVDGDSNTDIRYIRITDVDEFGNLKNDDWKTTKNIDKKYLLEENDILFARSGATAGKTFIYRNEFGKAIFAGYLIRFKIDEKKANPLFVFYYTQLKRYGLWVKSIQRPSGQPNINSEEFKSFEIPLPPLDIQNQIAEMMESAYNQKKQKEAEAQAFLDSISNYVLGELGVELPVIEDQMCFTFGSNELEGRLDPFYHKPQFIELYKRMLKSKYKVVPFEDLIIDLKNGVEIRTYSDAGYRYLRVTDLGEYGINSNDPRFVDVKGIPQKIKLTKNDFLVSRSGSLGLVSGVTDEIIDAILSSHIFKVSLGSNKVRPEYLEVYFRSRLGQFQFFQKNNGGIVPEINQSALKSLKVILAPLEVQNKIIEEVKKRMIEAEKLRNETNKIIEEAKKDAENIILG